jgi:hypothetical protein
MNGARKNCLASSTFSSKKDCRVGWRHLSRQIDGLLHGRAGTRKINLGM